MKPGKAVTRTVVALVAAGAVLAGVALAGAGSAEAAGPARTPVATVGDAPRWT